MMMRILGTGLPVPLLRRAFRKEFREQGAPAPKGETPKGETLKPERNAESESEAKTEQLKKGKRSKPKASDEPPRTWRVALYGGRRMQPPVVRHATMRG
jgi:hypothetical protein